MEPITVMIGTVVGYLAKSLKDNKSVKEFFNEFTDATIKEIKPLFLKEDGEPKEALQKLQENPDSTVKQNAVIATIESEIEDQPELIEQLRALYAAIQSKPGNITQINQTHHGSGDNVGGSKYNINNQDAKIGQQNIDSNVDNKGANFTNQ